MPIISGKTTRGFGRIFAPISAGSTHRRDAIPITIKQYSGGKKRVAPVHHLDLFENVVRAVRKNRTKPQSDTPEAELYPHNDAADKRTAHNHADDRHDLRQIPLFTEECYRKHRDEHRGRIHQYYRPGDG